jgi:hypothetical protein
MSKSITEYTFEDMALSENNHGKSTVEKLYADNVKRFRNYKRAIVILLVLDALVILITATLIILGIHPVQTIEHTEKLTLQRVIAQPLDKCSVITIVNTLLILVPISAIYILENIIDSLDLESSHRRLIEFYTLRSQKLRVYAINVKLTCKNCKKTSTYTVKPLYTNTEEQAYKTVPCAYCNKPINSLVNSKGQLIKVKDLDKNKIKVKGE